MLGGIAIGIAVGSMHFLGMAALEVPGRVTWSLDLVSASIAARYRAQYRRDICRHVAISASAMTVVASLALSAAIVGLHFTAMGAVGFVPDPRTRGDAGLDRAQRACALCSRRDDVGARHRRRRA